MSTPSGVKLNRLAREKSPYLLQHAANPVDWFPWGKDAFEKAAKEDKPVFLSIGYSACHWCHVMERESFEDGEVARLMNETFVCVKVDREERPDLDREYLEVCRTMTGGAGWPLTIIMTSSKKPFFAGTYFPRKACFNQVGMLELIPLIKDIWQTRRGEVEALAEAAVGGTAQQPAARRPGEPGESTLELAQANLAQSFDDINGGFGYAPKFPPASNLVFLLRHWKRTGNRRSLAMVEKTLEAMSRGGIYDQVGHGFHRYATDRAWKVPHFEKMLYDQALLVMAYTEAWQATGRPLFKRIAREVCDYVLRDLTAPEGGFYSAEDADSEGKEGRFYTWTEAEIRKVLDKSEADRAIKMFAVQPQGNFGSGPDENPDSANILRLAFPPAEERLEEEIRKKLFAERQKRARPAKDDKILADWNGLMIAALAKAGRAFGACAYTAAAERAADFMAAKMRGEDRRLLHRYRDGEAAIGGFLDDYAFLAWGLIELYQAGFDLRHLRLAAELAGILLDHFWDKIDGGFYFTADDATDLPGRRKEIYDDMLPAGNAVAMLDLLRLSRMSGDVELEKKAAGLGSAFAAAVLQAPAAGAFFLVALDFALGPSYEVVVAGRSRDIATFDMLANLAKAYIPNAVVMLRRAEQEPPDIDGFSSFTRYQPIVTGRTVAYACANGACAKPTPDIASLLELLGAGSGKGAAE